MSGYDSWKTETPEDEQERLNRLLRPLRRALLGKRQRDPDDARDEQIERERDKFDD